MQKAGPAGRRGRGRAVRYAAVRLAMACAAAMAGFVVFGAPSTAVAEVSGAGCSAHIVGVDVGGVNSHDDNTAILVAQNSTISVDLTGDTGSPQTIHVDYGLVGGITIGKDGSGTSASINVRDYASITGLYLVTATSGPNHTCTAAALVRISGSATSTIIGYGALGAGALGTLAILGGFAVAAGGAAEPGASMGTDAPAPPELESAPLGEHEGDIIYDPKIGWYKVDAHYKPSPAGMGRDVLVRVPFCGAALPMALMLTTLAMVGVLPAVPGGSTAAIPPPPRARWRPRLSALGIIGSIIGTVGAVVFMELNGNVYPTRTWAIEALVGGLLVGLIVPSLGNAVKVWRINRRIRAAVARGRARTAARAAAAEVAPPPGPPPAEPPTSASEASPAAE